MAAVWKICQIIHCAAITVTKFVLFFRNHSLEPNLSCTLASGRLNHFPNTLFQRKRSLHRMLVASPTSIDPQNMLSIFQLHVDFFHCGKSIFWHLQCRLVCGLNRLHLKKYKQHCRARTTELFTSSKSFERTQIKFYSE